MIEQKLENIGFSPSEIKIYLFLIKAGNCPVNKICVGTDVNRTNVYEALNRLIKKGIVSYIIKDNVKWFNAMPSITLSNYIDIKEQELSEIKTEVIKEISNLTETNSSDINFGANIFVGKKALKLLFDDLLKDKSIIRVLSSEHQFKSLFPTYFEQWHKKRIDLGIIQRSIFSESHKKKIGYKQGLELRFIPDEYSNPTSTFISKNNCLFVQWDQDPLIIRITSPKIIKSHINYFDVLWQSAKPK